MDQPLGAHDAVRHSEREYARGAVHANSAEAFNDRVHGTFSGVFHPISTRHAGLYFKEIGFRWSQRRVAGRAILRSRKGREVVRTLWSRIAPALQLRAVYKQQLAANCDGPRPTESQSNAQWLSS